jgi:hypothetical protein
VLWMGLLLNAPQAVAVKIPALPVRPLWDEMRVVHAGR